MWIVSMLLVVWAPVRMHTTAVTGTVVSVIRSWCSLDLVPLNLFPSAAMQLVECLPTCLAPGEKPKYEPTTSGAHLVSRYAAVQPGFVKPAVAA